MMELMGHTLQPNPLMHVGWIHHIPKSNSQQQVYLPVESLEKSTNALHPIMLLLCEPKIPAMNVIGRR